MSGGYTSVVDVGKVTMASVSDLEIGTVYFFAVTAYNTQDLESSLSNEVAFTPSEPSGRPSPPAAVKDLSLQPDGTMQFTVSTYVTAPEGISIWVSDDLVEWSLLTHIDSPPDDLVITDPGAASARTRFYRVSAP